MGDGLCPIGGVVSDALLKLPLLRRAVTWMGVRRASSASIVKMFAEGFKVCSNLMQGDSRRQRTGRDLYTELPHPLLSMP